MLCFFNRLIENKNHSRKNSYTADNTDYNSFCTDNTKIYYNIAKSLPSTLESNVANEKLEEDFDMSVLHMVMMDKNMDAKDKRDMLNAIDEVDGVKWTISLTSSVAD